MGRRGGAQGRGMGWTEVWTEATEARIKNILERSDWRGLTKFRMTMCRCACMEETFVREAMQGDAA